MNPSMSFKEYFSQLHGSENEPASLKKLLAPFHVAEAPAREDDFILIGHVLDALNADLGSDGRIHPYLIIELATELGLDAAA